MRKSVDRDWLPGYLNRTRRDALGGWTQRQHAGSIFKYDWVWLLGQFTFDSQKIGLQFESTIIGLTQQGPESPWRRSPQSVDQCVAPAELGDHQSHKVYREVFGNHKRRGGFGKINALQRCR